MDVENIPENDSAGPLIGLTTYHIAIVHNSLRTASTAIFYLGLNPNSIFKNIGHKPCICENGCEGRTLLFIACTNKRIEIVRMLLAAGADPEKVNEDDGRTPFSFAIREGHTELLTILLRENSVHPNVPPALPPRCCDSLSYTIFRYFHNDREAINVLMRVRDLGRKCSAQCPPSPHVAMLVSAALQCRSSNLGIFLVDFCGSERIVNEMCPNRRQITSSSLLQSNAQDGKSMNMFLRVVAREGQLRIADPVTRRYFLHYQ